MQSEQFPIDGKTQYGLMRSYLGWKVEAGQLWEVRPQHLLLGDWATDPIRLADYSHSADVETALVDVGDGSHESDYSGKDVRGKDCSGGWRAGARAGAGGAGARRRRHRERHAEPDHGVVGTGPHHRAMGSPGGASCRRDLPSWFRGTPQSHCGCGCAAGEQIVLSAKVKAEVGPGHWTVVSGTIPGDRPGGGEIVYSCHLDHERPGANDNGSGCVTILESARVLARLIASGALPRPKRTLALYLGAGGGRHDGLSQPAILKSASGCVADIHMDMVGGDPFKNKSILHVTETPWSLPSFVTDVGATFAEVIRSGAANYAESGDAPEAAVVETRAGEQGTRNQFLADVTPYSAGQRS